MVTKKSGLEPCHLAYDSMKEGKFCSFHWRQSEMESKCIWTEKFFSGDFANSLSPGMAATVMSL